METRDFSVPMHISDQTLRSKHVSSTIAILHIYNIDGFNLTIKNYKYIGLKDSVPFYNDYQGYGLSK